MATEPTKKILSIDLGTKNLAFCVLTIKDTKISILRWGIIDVHTNLDTPKPSKPTISQLNKALQQSLLLNRLEEGVDLVAIENQPAGFHRSSNTKMKTLSHCIEAYMFHKLPNKPVMFISPKSKFVFSPEDEVKRVKALKTSSARYRNHKKMAIQAVKCRIDNGSISISSELLSLWDKSKKKDDLADCLLQGMYCGGLRH